MLLQKVVTFTDRIKMTVFVFDFFGSDLSKMDQTWSKWISFTERIKMPVMFLILFGPDLSKMDQIWSNWISHQTKNITIKSCHIYRKDKNDCFVFDLFGSDLSKMDQTWSNWISHQSKKCYSSNYLTTN